MLPGSRLGAQPALSFGGLLRQLRDDAGLTREELAEAASLFPRSVSDLERGVNLTARHDTARLLAGALGLSGPQRALFEAAARGRVPADQVLAAGDGGLGTLPRPLTSFVGRQPELAKARRLLESSRLLTVTGPGGGGKTRLCIELAAAVAADYPDGVYFVPLTSITDPGLVLSSIVLGLDALRMACSATSRTRPNRR